MANAIGMEEVVELDENERYWVGKGFGKGGLLPNDRGAYSTSDGTISWKSLQEASDDLMFLGRGWTYYKGTDNQFAPLRPDHPDDCWMYATDFRNEQIQQATPDRGALHWVRCRRLVRVKVFNPEEFVSRDIYEKCDHCDLEVVSDLARFLLDILTYISMLHNRSHETDAILLPLKQSIVDMAIAHEAPEETNTNTNSNANAKSNVQMLRRNLENFIEKERSKTKLSRLLSSIDFSFPGRTKSQEFKERRDIVEARCFPEKERSAIAGLIVRKLDPQFQLHCNRIACGDDCPFVPVTCPNEGCNETMSKINLDSHDAQCGCKIVQCECGETFKAYEQPAHRSEACPLRPVDCPFKAVGCIKEVRACEVEQHVTEDVASHLLLAVGRIQGQDEVIQNLHKMLGALRSEKEQLSRNLQEHKDNYAKEVSQLQTKTTQLAKDLGEFQKSSKKEFKRLNSPRQSLK